jgi:hypothetical protein
MPMILGSGYSARLAGAITHANCAVAFPYMPATKGVLVPLKYLSIWRLGNGVWLECKYPPFNVQRLRSLSSSLEEIPTYSGIYQE